MGRGRDTKLTPERQQKIVELIAGGNYAEIACKAAGISKQTFYNWKARGEEGQEQLYVDFLDAVEKAEAEAEANAIEVVLAAAPKNWAAAMTFLERRFASRWSRRTEVSGPDGGPIPLAAAEKLLDESLAE